MKCLFVPFTLRSFGLLCLLLPFGFGGLNAHTNFSPQEADPTPTSAPYSGVKNEPKPLNSNTKAISTYAEVYTEREDADFIRQPNSLALAVFESLNEAEKLEQEGWEALQATYVPIDHPAAQFGLKNEKQLRTLYGDDAYEAWLETATDAHLDRCLNTTNELELATGMVFAAEHIETLIDGMAPVQVELTLRYFATKKDWRRFMKVSEAFYKKVDKKLKKYPGMKRVFSEMLTFIGWTYHDELPEELHQVRAQRFAEKSNKICPSYDAHVLEAHILYRFNKFPQARLALQKADAYPAQALPKKRALDLELKLRVGE